MTAAQRFLYGRAVARWIRVVIEMEEPAMNRAGVEKWAATVVTGHRDGEETDVEPVEVALVPRTINWRAEEYEAPAAP